MQKSVSCDDYLEVVVCVRGEACWPDIFLVDPSFVDSKNEIDSLEMIPFRSLQEGRNDRVTRRNDVIVFFVAKVVQ